jgi:2-oxoglutarate ferredoxin oxidoreductase subunit alpha
MSLSIEPPQTGSPAKPKPVTTVAGVTIRFCGDSGDGMRPGWHAVHRYVGAGWQPGGTLPDFPAEIRSSGRDAGGRIGFRSTFPARTSTPGDTVHAAGRDEPGGPTNIGSVRSGGIVIVNEDVRCRRSEEAATPQSPG